MLNEKMPVIDLISAIDSRLKKVHTQALDLSFNELLDMHKNKELNINPDYQRLFQWSEGARSRFVESLLLEMPVPPIYVIEEDDGTYLLIDGLQRISSYLHLRGELAAPHLDPPVAHGQKLQFVDCDIVKELDGRTFDDIGTALQIKLKRAFIRVEVVRKGSDPRFKYWMFKRLNTGGARLSDQQIRNCSIRLLSPNFNDFLIELSESADFQSCVESLTQERKISAYDQELVLRFFTFKNQRELFKHDVADFLTDYMEAVSDPNTPAPFDYAAERTTFLKTFAILNKTLGDKAFTYANQQQTKITRGFSVYHFEAFTVGLQARLAEISLADEKMMTRLSEELPKIKLDPEFIKITTGGGKNSPGPLKARIAFVEAKVAGLL
jgi:hypothetical protein